MKPIALLFNGVWSQYAFATAPKYRPFYELVYVHELDDAALAGRRALVIPFQSDHDAIARHRAVIYRFLGGGGTVCCFGDSSPRWLDAQWADRPVNNWWWKEDPDNPPVAATDFGHPLFAGLAQRHACWHTHGAYERVPHHARVLQTNGDGEVITWQTHAHGGLLLASTLDPIVEHGIQQIAHLDNFCDNLTEWLCGERPAAERLTVDPACYGVRDIA